LYKWKPARSETALYDRHPTLRFEYEQNEQLMDSTSGFIEMTLSLTLKRFKRVFDPKSQNVGIHILGGQF